MTADKNYGDISVWQKIQLISEWSPLLSYGQRFLQEQDAAKKSVVVLDGIEWLSSKTETKFDDELAAHLSAVLKSDEGVALVKWVVGKAGL